jgi:hypothetical protein
MGRSFRIDVRSGPDSHVRQPIVPVAICVCIEKHVDIACFDFSAGVVDLIG